MVPNEYYELHWNWAMDILSGKGNFDEFWVLSRKVIYLYFVGGYIWHPVANGT